MLNKVKSWFKKIYNKLNIFIIFLLWLLISFLIFYKGSNNVGIWGKWQGLEIIMPLIISFFISSIIVFFIHLVIKLFKNKKENN